MNITRRIDNLRTHRVALRRRIKQAQSMADPIDRRAATDQLSLQLAMTDSEWAQLNHMAGRRVGGRPVRL